MSVGRRSWFVRTGSAVVFLMTLMAAHAWGSERTLSPLVAPEWLAQHLDSSNLVLLDVRSDFDGGNDVAFEQAHIPGSVHSDYQDAGWRVEQGGTPGMRPDVQELEVLIRSLGIDRNSVVVIIPAGTGPTDFGSAARVYWTLKSAGLDQLGILNGGFKAWRSRGLPVSAGSVSRTPETSDFKARWSDRWLASLDRVKELVAGRSDGGTDSGARLIDARPAPYFRGERKSWQSHRAGTLPEAGNLVHSALVNRRAGGHFVDREQVRAVLEERGLMAASQQPLITFCTTGHWASTDWFVLSEVAGFEDVRLYDGSMVQWTQDPDRPVANGREGMARALDWF